MIGFVFPGQASQFQGMGKDIYENSSIAKDRFEEANDLLGFDITKVMFEGTAEELKETRVTQPAVFLHGVILVEMYAGEKKPDMVAGHSLGEFSALVANKVLSFSQGLELVRVRAEAMQEACDKVEGTMAAIVGLDDYVVENICRDTPGVVIAANYNCPGQLVISGEVKAVEKACEAIKDAGARRAIPLAVGGAFHSSLMEPARKELEQAIKKMSFSDPSCPIYQNVNGLPQTDLTIIKQNLIDQLTSPVKWTTTIQNMLADGVTEFVEVGGTGKVLQGMIKRIDRSIQTSALIS